MEAREIRHLRVLVSLSNEGLAECVCTFESKLALDLYTLLISNSIK